MEKKVLIISSSYDLTVDYIIKKFPTLNYFRLNTDKMEQYNIFVSNNPFSWEIMNEKESINFQQTRAIYYRKPAISTPRNSSPQYHSLILKENLSFVEGLAETFEGKCLSRPSIMKRADNKILQLKLAEEVGFNIPKSCITNSNSRAQSFSRNHKKLYIVKPLSVGKIVYRDGVGIIQTNLLNKKKIKGLQLAPAYFQEYCHKDFEIRVTIVGRNIFPVRIDSFDKVDWRKSPDKIKYSLYKLPNEIEKKCVLFLKRLSLTFGAFDFIVKDGKFYFLEVNANGQWGWLDEKLGLPISGSIVDHLLGKGEKCIK